MACQTQVGAVEADESDGWDEHWEDDCENSTWAPDAQGGGKPGAVEFLRWPVKACFVPGSLAGEAVQTSGNSGDDEREPCAKRQRRLSPPDWAAKTCRHCDASLASSDRVRLDVRWSGRGQAAFVACRACGGSVPGGCVSRGSVLRMGGGSPRRYLVCAVRREAVPGGGNPLDGCFLHCQRLSPNLRLPFRDEELTLPLHGDSTYRLLAASEQPHVDVACTRFAQEWACGRADVLPGGARIFYTVQPTCDQLSLPDPASCPALGCGCLDPWAAHRHGPAELAEDGASCRHRGESYRRGDLAWVVPHGAPEVDAELHLGRVAGFRCVALDDSETQELTPGCGPEGLPVLVQYQRYERADGVQGGVYAPAAEPPRECRVGSLAGLASLPRHAPGCRLGDCGSFEPAAPEWRATPVDATAPAEAAAEDATPSGSDGSAHLSWGSDEGEDEAGSCAASPRPGERQAGGEDGQRSGGAAGGQRQPFAGVEIADVFCGFGGLSLGIERALPGAKVRWACDLFKEALATFQNCHPGAQTFEADACEFLAGIRAGRRDHPRPGWQPGDPPRVLVGGPPCQGFSNASSAEQAEKERKNVLVPLFLEILSELRWPYAVMENVVGLLSTEGTMQRIMQAAVSMGYQLAFRVLNAGSYGTAQHRRRVIVFMARHGLPMPAFPRPTTVFSGAGGYRTAGFGSPSCSLKDREAQALKRVPLKWQANVEVPRHAPLPALSAHDCLADLPREAGAAAYDRPPHSAFAARMRAGGLEREGAALCNHVTQRLQPATLRRISLVPRQGAPLPPGLERWQGERRWVANPFLPLCSGSWQSLPTEELPEALAELVSSGDGADGRKRLQRWAGILARMTPDSHFATVTTSPALNSDTTSTTLHWDADRPMTVRESARAQGVPDSVRFEGCTAACYKQVGNAVPVPLAEALGRELGVALAALRPSLPCL